MAKFRFASLSLTLLLLSAVSAGAQLVLNETFAKDPKQPIDAKYTEAIKKYTTEPRFGSPLVDYLPASSTVASWRSCLEPKWAYTPLLLMPIASAR